MPEFDRHEIATLLTALKTSTVLWSQAVTDDRVNDALVRINMGQLDRIHALVRKLGGNPEREDFGAGDYRADPGAGS